MRRGTTPTQKFTIPFLAEEISDLIITYKQSKVVFEKRMSDCTVENNYISVKLSQYDTLSLKESEGVVYIQLKILLKSGDVLISKIMRDNVQEAFNEEILGNE